MNKTTTQITDEELTAKLKESHLASSEKETLEPLIPHMDDSEREALMGLIEEASDIKNKQEAGEAKYQEALRALNQEYEEKMNTVIKEEMKNARKQFEAKEQAEEGKELEEIESELSNM